MKIKASIAAFVGALTLVGANAGDSGWTAKDVVAPKAPIEDSCPDVGGELSVGYDTDYIFRGVRFARENAWADVNYTLDTPFGGLTVGAWGLTDLGGLSNSLYGDEFNFYGSYGLPSFLGFDASLGFTKYLFNPSGILGNAESHEFNLTLAREIFGLGFEYFTAYDFGAIEGWYHQASVGKSIAISDAVGLDLTAGVGYSDNYNFADSGWNHYYLQAALPIALNCRATVTPYIGYNGTPDTWVGDQAQTFWGANQGDALHGGVSVTVGF